MITDSVKVDKTETNRDRLIDLSLFESSYGPKVQELVEGGKGSIFEESFDPLGRDRSTQKLRKSRKIRNSWFHVPSGCWVYKIQNTSRIKGKVGKRESCPKSRLYSRSGMSA